MCCIAHVGREAVVNLCIEYAQGLYEWCCQHVRAEVLREACVAPRPSQAGVSDHWLIHTGRVMSLHARANRVHCSLLCL